MSMTIANRLKRIASKWGVESKSHTIEDVLEDLEKNLPFSVTKEMVEIMPEQSVTIIGTMTEITNVIHENYKTVTENSNLYLTVDGKEMKCNFAGIHHDMLGFMAENEKLAVVFNSSAEVISLSDMSGEYDGKTVTVKVFTKQEIVKQIDPKFVVGSTILTYSENDDIKYLRRYNPVTDELGEKVTKSELFDMVLNGAVYFTSYSYEKNYGYFYSADIQFHDEYGVVMDSTGSAYTSEYTESSGPV